MEQRRARAGSGSGARAPGAAGDAAAIADARTAARRWVERVVVGLDLCPFAGDVLRGDRLRIAVCDAASPEGVLAALDAELARLLRTEVRELETTLLVLANALRDFDAFNAFLDVAEELVRRRGCEGVVQIASFHPEYRFAAEAPDDPASFTNRSPHPMLHLLREESVALAVASHPDPAAIPARNVARMRAMGADALRALVAACLHDSAPPPRRS